MKDRDHHEATAELLQQDASFAADYLRQCLINGTSEDIRAGLRQMTGLLASFQIVGASEPNFKQATGLFDRAGVRYEVACDVMGALIAHYAEIIAKERDRAQADEAVLRMSSVMKAVLKAERDELNPRDSAAIEATISYYAPLTRQIHDERKIDAELQSQRRADFFQANTFLVFQGLVTNDNDRAVQALLVRSDITQDEAVQCYRILRRYSS